MTDEEIEQRALTIIRDSIRRKGVSPFEVESFDLDTVLAQMRDPKASEMSFEEAVCAWLRAVETAIKERGRVEYRRVDDDAWDEPDWWREVHKPWLTALVGWGALTAYGRAAGEEGYRLLANHWTARWRAFTQAQQNA